MRLGLVVVGTAFAVVGAAVIVGLLQPGDGPNGTWNSTAAVDGLSGGSWEPFVLPAVASDPATVTLAWAATSGPQEMPVQVNVSLFGAHMCPSVPEPCVIVPALAFWNGSGPGAWTQTGSSLPMYVLVVVCVGSSNASVDFSATLLEHYHTSALSLPPVPFAITMVGGGLLTGVGAVGLYLGLFLPPGLYGSSGLGDPELEAWDSGRAEDPTMSPQRPQGPG